MAVSHPQIQSFHDPDTGTISHVAACGNTGRCAVIDPVLDYDFKSASTATRSADRVVEYVERAGLETEWILETHVHADHLSAAPYVKSRLGGKVGISRHIAEVQQVFNDLFNIDPNFVTNGQHFDHLFDDGEGFRVGEIPASAMHTPGHTPACLTYVIGDAAFVGDTLFMPDSGTARADFPGGDARTLFRSARTILALAPETRLFICHDYGADGRREPAWESTVAEQREKNIHVRDGVSEDEFVAMRQQRDATLSMPQLILPSVQVNMCGGHLPPSDENGISYIKIPVNKLAELAGTA